MSNLSKILWISAMLLICGIGIFAGNRIDVPSLKLRRVATGAASDVRDSFGPREFTEHHVDEVRRIPERQTMK